MDTETITMDAQPEQTSLANVQLKTHFTGTVVKTTLAGAIVDIGLDKPGVVHISQLQRTAVNRVEDVLQVGQTVDVWVKRVFPKKGRIELTMIEPLDLEWREIEPDAVLKGKVTRLEKFGAFVDVGAERPGLIHISELAHGYVKDPSEILSEGDEVEVKVLKVNRCKKQIKLSLKAMAPPPEPAPKPEKQPRAARPKPVEEPVEEEAPIPTAMEIALREAMERSQQQAPVEPPKNKPKQVANNQELEDILNRTLQNKVQSTK